MPGRQDIDNKSSLRCGRVWCTRKTRSLSTCLRHGPATGGLEGRAPSARVSTVVCWCFLQIRVPKGRMLMNKNQNGSAKVPKAANIEPTWCPTRPRWSRKSTNMSKRCFKFKPSNIRFFFWIIYVSCCNQHGKNGLGALVGLTLW